MRTRRQLLIWTLVILVLSLVLFNRLRDTSAMIRQKPRIRYAVSALSGHLANEVRFDVTQIDLTSISESDLLESREKSNEKSVVQSQSTETTTETLGYKTE